MQVYSKVVANNQSCYADLKEQLLNKHFCLFRETFAYRPDVLVDSMQSPTITGWISTGKV